MTNTNILKELDYKIDDVNERMNHVSSVLNKHDGDITTYFDTYYNPSLNKSSSLSDKDSVCRQLEIMADYILYADKDKKEDKPLKKNRVYHINKKEVSSEKVSQILDYNKGSSLKEGNVRKRIDYKVKKEDRLKYKELSSMATAIGYLKFCYLNGFKPDDRIKEGLIDIASMSNKNVKSMASIFSDEYIENNKLTNDEKRLYKKTEINLRKEEVEMNKMLHGYFTFNDGGTTVITLDDNTGYYNKDGDYIEITDNKVDVCNYKHMYEVIKLYSDLKEYSYEELNSNTKYLIFGVEESIDNAELSDHERDIVLMIIDRSSQANILKMLRTKYSIEISQSRLSQIITSIMKKISEYSINSFKNWAHKRFDFS